ncbi:hypothetical protein Glove_374g46 [Diversispora epigaea]|uniref:Uncharacterized protein n=1 Tax=Diversispora epigaea TaxID=1348612 RepID=A0A397H9E3_9GLOM|nr:hypothetical protein Glove_374g46 [Diversispora epigaea]
MITKITTIAAITTTTTTTIAVGFLTQTLEREAGLLGKEIVEIPQYFLIGRFPKKARSPPGDRPRPRLGLKKSTFPQAPNPAVFMYLLGTPATQRATFLVTMGCGYPYLAIHLRITYH